MSDQPKEKPVWLCKMLQAIYDMRQAQNKYFAHNCAYNLRVSKEKERQVDSIVREAIAKGYVKEAQEIKHEQPTLFKTN